MLQLATRRMQALGLLSMALWLPAAPLQAAQAPATSVRATTMDTTPSPTENLRRAIARGDAEAALALLPGADLRERNALGGTLLHDAANFSGDLRLLRALLKAGVPVDARDDDDQTALHLALRHAHYAGTLAGEPGRKLRAVVELLLEHGARLVPEPRPVSPEAPSLLQTLLLKQIEPPFLDLLVRHGLQQGDDTLLDAVASADQPETVQRALRLLKQLPAAQLQQRDAQGQTAAHKAAGHAQRLPLLKALGQRGADLHAVDQQGVTVFAEAAGSGQVEAMAWLAGQGALTMAADADGFTPLHRAAMDPRPQPLQWLLQHGAALDARDRLGRRALDVAIDTRRFAFRPPEARLALLRLLGGSEADLPRARVAQPPLYLAVTSPDHDLRRVEQLLQQGADANVRNEDGHTPLQSVLQGISMLPNTPATRAFCRKVLPLLLRHGADPRRVHDPWDGRTYLDIARHLRVLDELERAMKREMKH